MSARRTTIALTVTLTLIAAPAGCAAGAAGTPPATFSAREPTAAADRRPAPAGNPAGAGSSSAAATPPNGTDLLFATMMVSHHAQAVRMSRTLLSKPEVPERVAAIARFIAADQQREIDEMNAWLQAWGRAPVDPDDPAVARQHGAAAASHGMLTEAQLTEAAAAAAPAATRLYLQQMIEHHVGAITMARSVLDAGRNVYVRNLARHIINEQSSENDAMRRILAELPARV